MFVFWVGQRLAQQGTGQFKGGEGGSLYFESLFGYGSWEENSAFHGSWMMGKQEPFLIQSRGGYNSIDQIKYIEVTIDWDKE